jgi:hypothetical protein
VRLSATEGHQLEAGKYVDSQRSLDEDDALIAVHGMHGCGAQTGKFTVHNVKYGPPGYVRSLHVTFEQYCDGSSAALHGEIAVTAKQAPPRLKMN